ncbi:hypothetical protein EV130_1062 [Rhizobium azibense]|uniref:Uncharacterized protein n=1 Tax=Rhizobium azibense TaxID=1136135 RepID=A0A4R3QRA5_9HYPH|nr:hypothetical protein [Rhizobium azibense]TCU24411.1 hypothetical protein EV130_1062 [Rhizobium azibense]
MIIEIGHYALVLALAAAIGHRLYRQERLGELAFAGAAAAPSAENRAHLAIRS